MTGDRNVCSGTKMKKAHNVTYELPFFSFDIHELNQWAATVVGHSEPFDPHVVILDRPTLASIWTTIEQPRIELHPLFNISWLPVEVIQHILIHEHIHRAIRPREVEPGNMKAHPPEFWEMERRLSPHGSAACCWMYLEWGDLLKRDEENECIWVKRGWKKSRNDRRKFFEKLHRDAGVEPPPERFTTWEDALARSETHRSSESLM